jgi:predicted glycosyltransferase involved in capsule biosynthesis
MEFFDKLTKEANSKAIKPKDARTAGQKYYDKNKDNEEWMEKRREKARKYKEELKKYNDSQLPIFYNFLKASPSMIIYL